jgi:peptide/nickel transport system permease protein
MTMFVVRRFLQTIPVLMGVALIAFVLSELSGNPVRGMLGPSASPEVIRKLEEFYGYDKPRSQRFVSYISKLACGDLGVSMSRHGQPTREMIFNGLKVTAKLALGAILIASFLGLLTGILSAWRPNSLLDYSASVGAALGVSFPAFFLGMLLLLVFAVKLNWLPVGGYKEGEIQYLILPCLALGLISTASIGRLTRNCMLETLSLDYIRAARAKGLSEWRVLLGHAVPNALVPVVTIIGNDFAGLLCGAVLTETVFGLPGIGLVLYNAIFSRDLPVVMGCCVALALIFVALNFLVDVSYAFLDPRIHHA